MSENKQAGNVRKMFGRIALRYDLANSILSFGMHHLWRRKLIAYANELNAKLVCDLACGTGDVKVLFERHGYSVLGLDFCYEMLKVAQQKTAGSSTGFVQADALRIPLRDQSVDLVTIAFGIRNFENVAVGLKEACRVLKPGGSILILEFGQPQNRLWRFLFGLYSRYWIPFVGGMLTGSGGAYRYLNSSSAEFPCGQEFMGVLQSNGFTAKRVESLAGGIAYLYHACR